MKAGNLDRRLTIQRVTLSQNDYGEEVETWADIARVWAWKRDVSARERFASAQTLAERTTVFQIRFRDDVNSKDRVVCEGRTYQITGITEVGRRQGLDLTCEGTN